jgi:hypothetical protein
MQTEKISKFLCDLQRFVIYISTETEGTVFYTTTIRSKRRTSDVEVEKEVKMTEGGQGRSIESNEEAKR